VSRVLRRALGQHRTALPDEMLAANNAAWL